MSDRISVPALREVVARPPADISAWALLALVEAVEAAQRLSHFLEEEKETREPPTELLDLGYVALETSADYEREEQLGVALKDALARFDFGEDQ